MHSRLHTHIQQRYNSVSGGGGGGGGSGGSGMSVLLVLAANSNGNRAPRENRRPWGKKWATIARALLLTSFSSATTSSSNAAAVLIARGLNHSVRRGRLFGR